MRYVNLSALGSGEHSGDFEFWSRQRNTLEEVEVVGSFGIGDVKGTMRAETLKDAGKVEVHRSLKCENYLCLIMFGLY